MWQLDVSICHKWTVGTAVPGRSAIARRYPRMCVVSRPSPSANSQPPATLDRLQRTRRPGTGRVFLSFPFPPDPAVQRHRDKAGRPGPHLIENLIPSRSTHATESSSISLFPPRDVPRGWLPGSVRPARTVGHQTTVQGLRFLVHVGVRRGQKSRARVPASSSPVGHSLLRGTRRGGDVSFTASRARSRFSALAHSDKMASFGC